MRRSRGLQKRQTPRPTRLIFSEGRGHARADRRRGARGSETFIVRRTAPRQFERMSKRVLTLTLPIVYNVCITRYVSDAYAAMVTFAPICLGRIQP